MEETRQALERAQSEPPTDLRAWIWSLAPGGRRVLVGAASCVMAPAFEAWRDALRGDAAFSAEVGADLVLSRARDAVLAWVREPTEEATAEVLTVARPLEEFLERVWFLAGELSGDGNLHYRAAKLARCIHLAWSAAAWSEADARREAAGDAAETASRIAAGPAFEVAEAISLYAALCPDHRDAIVRQIARTGLETLGEHRSSPR